MPYKGLAPAFNDVVAGHVPLMFGDFATALPLVQAGKLRALGVSTAQRVAAAPDIPPLAEAGLQGLRRVVLADDGRARQDSAGRSCTSSMRRLRAIVAEPAVQKDFRAAA